MRKVIFLISFALLLFSCSNDEFVLNDEASTQEVPVDTFQISQFHYKYVESLSNLMSHLADPINDNLVKFDYDSEGKIIKMRGGKYGPTFHSENSFKNLVHSGNHISIVEDIISGTSIQPDNQTDITLDSSGKMIKKTFWIHYSYYPVPLRDTTTYQYDLEGKLTYYEKSYIEQLDAGEDTIRYFQKSNVFYNAQQNMDSIVTMYSIKLNNYPETVHSKMVQKFEGYDSSENPFRKLTIFNETFNRSLSKNNYTSYSKTKYNYHSEGEFFYEINQYYTSWQLAYDENNQWIYNQF